jgi:hypothetical protein
VFLPAIRAVTRVVAARCGVRRNEDAVPLFNDDAATTHADVLAVLDEAAALVAGRKD